MKDIILIVSLLAVVSITHQCREDEKLTNAAEQQLLHKMTDSVHINSPVYEVNYEMWELDPDPPVRDGQDWRQP